jgi:hypothetical protein
MSRRGDRPNVNILNLAAEAQADRIDWRKGAEAAKERMNPNLALFVSWRENNPKRL